MVTVVAKEVSNFFTYSRKHCERIKGNVSISSYKTYGVYLDKFEKWVK